MGLLFQNLCSLLKCNKLFHDCRWTHSACTDINIRLLQDIICWGQQCIVLRFWNTKIYHSGQYDLVGASYSVKRPPFWITKTNYKENVILRFFYKILMLYSSIFRDVFFNYWLSKENDDVINNQDPRQKYILMKMLMKKILRV